jgi:hypothetical protein
MAFDYLCFFSNGANHQADLAIGNFGVNPFKNSDFDPNLYIDTMGWDADIAKSYTKTLKDMEKSKNRVFPLRVRGVFEFTSAVATGTSKALAGQLSPQEALDEVAKEWEAIVKRVGKSAVQEDYAVGVKMDVMGLIPIALIFGGRIGPYMIIFPVILQTIAGKNVRDIVYKQISHEDGTKSRIYNEAATLNIPFREEAMHLPLSLGWILYFIIPMGITYTAAFYFYKKHKTANTDPAFSGLALLIMGWLFFYLNFAFWGYPWPWEGWGEWPWKKWLGPSTTSAFFLLSMIALTFMVLHERKNDRNHTSFK